MKEENQVLPEETVQPNETVQPKAAKTPTQRSLKSDIADSAKEQLGELADNAKEQLSELADEVKETVSETGHNVLVWLFGTFMGWMVLLSFAAFLIIWMFWGFWWGLILLALVWGYAAYRRIKDWL